MAQLVSRCNLSAARHPLVSAFATRTIMVPDRGDTNFLRQAVLTGADQDRDVGIPQVFYMHNCMPTEHGYQSVGFSQIVAPAEPATEAFDQVIPITDSDGDKFLFVPASGQNFVFDAPVLGWASVDPITGVADTVLVTTAYVQGETYVFYENVGCFQYNKETKALDEVTLNGLVIEGIKGIVGSNGYLLCWDADGILYWSSATDPLDFVPSALTGAGSGNITDLKGSIVCILPTINGFIVYSTSNAVGGSFTGNLRFPFALKEIPGSGGIRSKEHVSYESNLEKHYALTSVGLQSLTKSTSEVILAETSDFLTSRIFEDFDSATKTWAVTYTSGDLRVKLTIVASRYFVVSYGITSLTHALIYDIAQKKWGKVKIDHVDCFHYTYPNLYGEITYEMLHTLGTTYEDLMETTYAELSESQATSEKPRRTIAFLQSDGAVQLLTFDLGQTDHDAVFLLGKYQLTRNHYMQLFGIEVENIDTGSNWEVWVLPSFDGKNFRPAVEPHLKLDSGYLRTYQTRLTGINQSLLFLGSFNLVGILIRYANGGIIRG